MTKTKMTIEGMPVTRYDFHESMHYIFISRFGVAVTRRDPITRRFVVSRRDGSDARSYKTAGGLHRYLMQLLTF